VKRSSLRFSLARPGAVEAAGAAADDGGSGQVARLEHRDLGDLGHFDSGVLAVTSNSNGIE
jgi:hypothetical protein